MKEETIDSIMNKLQIEHVNFVKIDVEGAELEVLEGIQRTLKNCDMPSIEVSHYPSQAEQVSTWLKKRGFKVYKYELPQTGLTYLFVKRFK